MRERQILDAAVEVFAERGFHQASMDEISDTAGVSKPMVYAYLGSKDELYLACVRREAGRLIDGIGTVVDEGLSPEQQLWRGLRVFFEHVGEHPAGWALLHTRTNPREEPFTGELTQWRSRAVTLVATLFADATADAEQPMRVEQMQPFAAALVGAAEALVDWWNEHPEHTADGLAMRLMNLTWMGFGDLVEGRSWAPMQSGPAR